MPWIIAGSLILTGFAVMIYGLSHFKYYLNPALGREIKRERKRERFNG